MTTTHDAEIKRQVRQNEAKHRQSPAWELEQRAASLSHTIATLDEERQRVLIQAALIRERERGGA